jgi:hypothetical protein
MEILVFNIHEEIKNKKNFKRIIIFIEYITVCEPEKYYYPADISKILLLFFTFKIA